MQLLKVHSLASIGSLETSGSLCNFLISKLGSRIDIDAVSLGGGFTPPPFPQAYRVSVWLRSSAFKRNALMFPDERLEHEWNGRMRGVSCI